MSAKHLSPSELCRRLATCTQGDCAHLASEVLSRLSQRWQAPIGSETASHSACRGVLELNHIRFLGANELGCLVLGSDADVKAEASRFWQQFGGSGRLGLVLAASTAVKEIARSAIPADRCVFIGNGEIETLLTHAHAIETLKQHIRAQIPVLRLMPYDITHPAAPNMFFGRRELLDRFHAEDTVSFAISGPGRIGKSSIIEQYRYEIRKNPKDDRRERLILIDCYPYGKLDPDALAQRLALDLSADSWAFRVNAGTFLRFLKHHSDDGHRPIEMLLDEVDSICENPLFEEIGQAVKSRYVRLFACGRGRLHRMMRRKNTQLAQRMEFIQPDPLDEASAEKLLREPLRDLGFELENFAAIRSAVFELTHRKPQMIHDCAKRIIELAKEKGTKSVTLADFEIVRFEMHRMADQLLPLEDLQSDMARLLMLLWLRAGAERISVSILEDMAAACHLELKPEQALDVCYDLWICNVLTMDRGGFTLASPHLVEHVRRMDFSKEIERLKHAVAQQQKSPTRKI